MTRPTDAFWAGKFGNEYRGRNRDLQRPALALFAKVLARTGKLKSALELGCGTGANLVALSNLQDDWDHLWGVELNEETAARVPVGQIICGNVLDFEMPVAEKPDLVITRGLLIHIEPSDLDALYQKIYHLSQRWILLAEYYNPTLIEVPYRGHAGRLWKRDWAGDMMGKFPNLRLADYGFIYHRDPAFPQDDVTWFLLEKEYGNG